MEVFSEAFTITACEVPLNLL